MALVDLFVMGRESINKISLEEGSWERCQQRKVWEKGVQKKVYVLVIKLQSSLPVEMGLEEMNSISIKIMIYMIMWVSLVLFFQND